MILEHDVFVKAAPKVIAGIILAGMTAWGIVSMWKSDFKKERKEIDNHLNQKHQERQR